MSPTKQHAHRIPTKGTSTTYRNRRAAQLESDQLRVTVLEEGGHVAELFHKGIGINPLWTPPWPTIEPSRYDPHDQTYGHDAESKLLAGLMGHNLCLDTFGGPSEEEAAAGMTVHGEASVGKYKLSVEDGVLNQSLVLEEARLRFARRIRFINPWAVRFEEEVENLSACDRPIAWTQHVTLGPPFLENGSTVFQATATKSKVFESDFTGGKGYMVPAAEFDWPFVPSLKGPPVDMRVFTALPVSGAFSTHLMDPSRAEAFFMAWSPKSKLLMGYIWNRADFPWLGIWEENHCRTNPPWNGQTVTRGMEFGVSPMPENRRRMIERGSLFGVPGYRWALARQILKTAYTAFVTQAQALPANPPTFA